MINHIITPRVAAVALAASALIAAPAFAEQSVTYHGPAETAIETVLTDFLGSNSSLSIQVGENTYGHRDGYNGRRNGTYRRRNGSYGHRGYSRRDDGYRRTGRGDRYGRHDRYGVNEWGQTRWETRELKREAIRTCRRAVHNQAYNIGFDDVDFNERGRVRQIGPYRFRVYMAHVEFERRRRRGHVDRDISCDVKRGYVRRVRGMPRQGYSDRNNGYYTGYSWSYSDFTPAQWRVYDRRHDGHDHDRGSYCPIDDNYRY